MADGHLHSDQILKRKSFLQGKSGAAHVQGGHVSELCHMPAFPGLLETTLKKMT